MGKLGAALFATFGSGVSLVDAFLGLVSFLSSLIAGDVLRFSVSLEYFTTRSLIRDWLGYFWG
jgi:hypothetical protein